MPAVLARVAFTEIREAAVVRGVQECGVCGGPANGGDACDGGDEVSMGGLYPEVVAAVESWVDSLRGSTIKWGTPGSTYRDIKSVGLDDYDLNLEELARRVVAAERERCAKVAEELTTDSEGWSEWNNAARDIAAKIRSGE